MENPFSTKFWSYGAIPFQFTEERNESIDTLLKKAYTHPVCQIVGPHGSGKSTLLLGLLKRYEKNDENVRYLFFNDQHRRIPDDITFQENQILFVDGFEQLSLVNRFWLLFRSKRLILTVHRPVWFVPILYRTKPQFSIFVQIVRQMVPDLPKESMLWAVYERSDGNFRCAFFDLYDQWEEASIATRLVA